jgi:hypothetical protein
MAINFDHQRDRISTSSRVLTINTTGALTVPVGTIAQRPTNSTGQIRFNTELQAFEGYNGTGWTSLGGVTDVDQNTFIRAETSPGANNNDLDFFTNGVQRLQIDETGDFLFGSLLNKFTIDFDTGDTAISGDLTVAGDVTIGGNIQIGDVDTDSINVVADFSSNLIPDIDATYNLGSNAKNWNTAFVQRLDSNTNVILVDITGALTLPVGTTAERPTASTGMIRFNTDDQRFEAYDGTAWTGVGGVIDVDQNTYIIAETSPGANNNDLDFYTDGVHRLQIDQLGAFRFGDNLDKFVIDWLNGNTAIAGYLDVNGQGTFASVNVEDLTSGRVVLAGVNGELEDDANLTFNGTTLFVTGNIDVTGNVIIGGNITIGNEDTDSITIASDFASDLIPDIDRTYNLGMPGKNWNILHIDSIKSDDDVITINASGALTLPVGTTLERPTATTGMIRFNTDDQRFEAYDGTAWTGVGGVIDVDQNTYIIAETSPGANNNDLDFYTDGVQRLQIDETGDFLFGADLNKFTIDFTTGDTLIAGDLSVAGSISSSTAVISGLTENRVVIVGASGELEDDANFTFDGNTFNVGPAGEFTVNVTSGNTQIKGTLNVDGQSTLASVNVEDLTDNRIVIAGTNGELEDSIDLTFNGTTLDIGQGNFTVNATNGNVFSNGDIIVNGDLTVNGTTTTVNSTTVTIDDPVFTLGSDDPLSNDGKDRGIEFIWHDGTTAKAGFFGYDNSTQVFTFIPDAINTSEVFSGTPGNVVFSNATLNDVDATNINVTTQADFGSASVLDLTTDRIVIAGVDGELEDDANLTFDGTVFRIGGTNFVVNQSTGNTLIAGTLEVDGQSTLASLNVEDLTDGRIVVAGSNGELGDSIDLTFNGTVLNVGQGNFTVAPTSGNIYSVGTLEIDGQSILASANIEDLTDNRIVIAGVNGELEDDANFTFNGTAFNVGATAEFTVDVATGNTAIAGTLDVDGQTILASVNVEDLTPGRVLLAGTNGEIEDSANLTFSSLSLLTVTGDTTITGNVIVNTNLDVDGQATAASINVEDLTSGRIVLAGTNGELEDNANLTFDGSTIAATATFNLTGAQTITSTLDVDGQTTLASVNVEDLTTGRIVLVGTNGELEDSANVEFDGTTFDLGQGNFTVNVSNGDVYANGDMTVNGDLTVNGTLTTINSTTVTIDDPVLTLGGDQTPTVDDNKDRGIEFKWHDGTFDRLGFFGFDDSTGKFTFIPNATNTAEVFSGTAGDAVFGNIDLSSATINSIRIGVSGSTTIDTTSGNLILDSANGTVEIDDNASISGTLGVTGEATLASATVSDLTINRIVLAGIAGSLIDSENLTFNGTTFNVGSGNFTVTQSTGTIYSAGNAQIIGTLNVDGQSTLASLNVEDLTDNRIVIAGTGGELEDSANLTFDGTTLSATATFNLTGAQTISSTLDVNGQTTLSSANVEDLTENRIVIVGVNGELEDDANFTFNGTTLTLTANQAVTGSVDITGDLDVDNININGNTISSTDLDGNINITPNGIGEVVISSATVSDLTDNRIVVAGTGGTLEDNANFRFDGTQFLIGPVLSPTFTVTVATGNTDISGNLVVDGSITSGTLTNDRVVIAGVNGILEDSANFTFDGTTLSVGQGNFTAQVATGNVNVNGTLAVGESATIGSAVGSTSTTTGALTVVGGVGIGENVYVGGNLSVDGTLGADGGVTLGDNIALDILTLNAKITGSLLPSANDTYSIGGTSETWKDLFLSESITFEGGTSENEIVLPTNQSDALSITETSGDLIVITTTSGARLITIYPNTVIEGTLTVGTSVSTTTIDEILDEDDFISNSDTALATQQSIKAYVDNVEANVELEFQGDTGSQGSVNLRTEVFTIAGTANEIETSSNAQTITIGLPNNVTIGNDLLVTNNFRVNGNTTTIDTPTLIADDRIITIGSVATLTANDGQDRGVEFRWHNGTSAKTGFFGYDNSSQAFTFVPDATNVSEVISGTPGNVTFGDGTFFGVIAGNISAGLVDDNTITTSTGNLTIDSTGGTVAINDNLSVTGTATLASAIVSDLTDNRIVIAGSSGLLEDSANFRFDGTNFSIGPSGNETFSVAVATGNTSVSGTLTVQQDADFGGNVTLGSISTNNIIFNGYVASNIIPDVNDTRDLGSSSNAWRDIYLSEAISFQGATSENEIVIPTNLADSLSIRDSAGDLIVITTTTGSQLITITPNVQIDGTFTLDGGVPVSIILDEDDMSSNSDVALATQQSIKAYVDNSVSDVDLNFAGGAGTGTVNLLTQTFTIAGIANEIETTALDQTLTIGLPDDVTVTNNLTVGGNTVITGNLTVNGSATTVSTTELVVEDNIITLNDGEVGAGVTAGSAGIEIDRGTEATVSFVWNEANDRWTAGTEDIEAGEFFGTIDGGTF